MSAQIRIMPAAEADQGFSLLKDIVEMVKNPKAIDEAYARRKKAAELTDEEVTKSAEARALIVKADDLLASLKQREDALLASKAEHDEMVSNQAKLAQAEKARLMEWESRLSEVASQQEQKERELADKNKAVDQRAIEIEAQHSIWQKSYEDRLAAISETEALHKAESERLAELEKKYKAKAARLAAEAAS